MSQYGTFFQPKGNNSTKKIGCGFLPLFIPRAYAETLIICLLGLALTLLLSFMKLKHTMRGL